MPTREQLRAFMERPWSALREGKDRYNAAHVAREGADEAFRVAEELAAHAREMNAVANHADDLEAAVRLKELIDRASRRLRRAR